jgi:hypothetical protein
MQQCLTLARLKTVTRVKPFVCTMPLKLEEGWNQVQFSLEDFCKRAYGTSYVETLCLQIHASCRVRRVYFSDRLYAEEELPAEYRLFMPRSPQVSASAAYSENRAAPAAPAREKDEGEEFAAEGEIAAGAEETGFTAEAEDEGAAA